MEKLSKMTLDDQQEWLSKYMPMQVVKSFEGEWKIQILPG